MRKLLTLSLVLVIVDQATKLAVRGFNLFGIDYKGMRLHESISVLGEFLRFTFVENPGMAFGLRLGAPQLLGLFSIGAAAFLVYLLRQSYSGKIEGFHISLAMILGGAVGNLIDRVFYGIFYGYGSLFEGKVVDFIDVDIPDISIFGFTLDRFYVFNVADSAVSVGIVLLLFLYPRHQRKEAEKKAALADNTATDTPILADELPPHDAMQTPNNMEAGSSNRGSSQERYSTSDTTRTETRTGDSNSLHSEGTDGNVDTNID